MFTGLVQSTGIASLSGGRLRVESDLRVAEGDSVSINGVCLTATALRPGGFDADVMPETLRRTTLGALGEGGRVNLELPLRASDRLGGHIVQGHIDATGTVESAEEDGFAKVIRISAPEEVLRYVVEKGSIAVDGVSLTVAEVDDEGFSVSLVPETLKRTNLGSAAPGRLVNIEVDVLAKYVEKLAGRVAPA
ncbi:MAG TPA: riboflavin synthase [Thermoleophilaceae bacterium]|nr:riboflavin synthase [Thermoleophilaceae bacterium]